MTDSDRTEPERTTPPDEPPADGTTDAVTLQKEGEATETAEKPAPDEDGPHFILYLEGERYRESLEKLTMWVQYLLLPVYGRETTSSLPWCPRWWEHQEAIAQLYGLWMAWQQFTGPKSDLSGPAMWHRDFLNPVMQSLRDPSGPFAGCKPGSHRPKSVPAVEIPGA
ncbi:DUF4913 domain-containing protein [Streptomyces sp. NPDC086091]|uniref:DUF4913 domain-containing protein n=1 Tax=Streptomyces sp. NPDC086091 TaxID=3365751 RepID=UPI00380E1E82